MLIILYKIVEYNLERFFCKNGVVFNKKILKIKSYLFIFKIILYKKMKTILILAFCLVFIA